MTSPSAKISKSLCSSLAVLALLSTQALADDRVPVYPAAYEEAYKAGTKLFEKEDFAGAREQYLAAYEIIPEPFLLLNIGSTYRRENNSPKAVEYYRRFLEEAAPANEYRAQVTQIVEELEQQIADEERKHREEEAAQPPPPAASIVDPVVESVVDPADTPRPGNGMRVGGLVTAGVGAVALGIGVQQGLRARSIHDELEGKMTGTEWTPEIQDRFEQGESAETRAVILTIGGGVILATGVTLYLLGRHRDNAEERPSVTLAPYTDGTSTGFAVAGSF